MEGMGAKNMENGGKSMNSGPEDVACSGAEDYMKNIKNCEEWGNICNGKVYARGILTWWEWETVKQSTTRKEYGPLIAERSTAEDDGWRASGYDGRG